MCSSRRTVSGEGRGWRKAFTKDSAEDGEGRWWQQGSSADDSEFKGCVCVFVCECVLEYVCMCVGWLWVCV